MTERYEHSLERVGDIANVRYGKGHCPHLIGKVAASALDTGNGIIVKFNAAASREQDYYVCLGYSQAHDLILALSMFKEELGFAKGCAWQEDSDGIWYPSCCTEAWAFDCDGPEENGMRHCMFCGGSAVFKHYSDAAMALTERISQRVTKAERRKVERRGGSAWVRKLIREAA